METTRILLINPPTETYLKIGKLVAELSHEQAKRIHGMPYHILTIAAKIVSEGHDAGVLDLCTFNRITDYKREEILEEIKNYDPEILGFTTFNASVDEALTIAGAYKEINPNTIIILGGPQADFMPLEGLKEMELVDVLVRNEGEEAMAEIASRKPINGIRSIAYKENGVTKENAPRPYADLDSLPSPYKMIKDIGVIETKDYEAARLLVSKGCPQSCDYCHQGAIMKKFGKKIRARKPDKVIEDIKIIREEYGIKSIAFSDNDLLLTENAHDVLIGISKENWDLDIFCLARLDRLSEEIVKSMENAGMQSMNLGVDSLNRDTLVEYRRIRDSSRYGAYVDVVEKGTKRLSKHGIVPILNRIIGMPKETADDVLSDVEYLVNIETTGMKEFYFPLYEPFLGTVADWENIKLRSDLERSSKFKTPRKFDTKYLTREQISAILCRIDNSILKEGKKYNSRLSIITLAEAIANFGGLLEAYKVSA